MFKIVLKPIKKKTKKLKTLFSNSLIPTFKFINVLFHSHFLQSQKIHNHDKSFQYT